MEYWGRRDSRPRKRYEWASRTGRAIFLAWPSIRIREAVYVTLAMYTPQA